MSIRAWRKGWRRRWSRRLGASLPRRRLRDGRRCLGQSRPVRNRRRRWQRRSSCHSCVVLVSCSRSHNLILSRSGRWPCSSSLPSDTRRPRAGGSSPSCSGCAMRTRTPPDMLVSARKKEISKSHSQLIFGSCLSASGFWGGLTAGRLTSAAISPYLSDAAEKVSAFFSRADLFHVAKESNCLASGTRAHRPLRRA